MYDLQGITARGAKTGVPQEEAEDAEEPCYPPRRADHDDAAGVHLDLIHHKKAKATSK